MITRKFFFKCFIALLLISFFSFNGYAFKEPTHEDIRSSIVQVQVSAGSDLILLQSAFQSFRLDVVEDIAPFSKSDFLSITLHRVFAPQ